MDHISLSIEKDHTKCEQPLLQYVCNQKLLVCLIQVTFNLQLGYDSSLVIT